jgi:hypothetical protein
MRLAALVVAAVICADSVLAQNLPTRPDDSLTPGAIASTDPAVVCGYIDGLSYSRRHRVWHDKADTLAKYGLPPEDRRLVEDDDRVPVCLGGDGADPRNHWPEPWVQARQKDRLEAEVCRMVCDERTMTLRAGQAIFLGDWEAGYSQMFGKPP